MTPPLLRLFKFIPGVLVCVLVCVLLCVLCSRVASAVPAAAEKTTMGSASPQQVSGKPSELVYPPVTPARAAQASAILVLFVILAVAIAKRKLSAMIALPLMALGIGIIAGVPLIGNPSTHVDGILDSIIEGKTSPKPTGSFLLYQAIIWIFFGGMFARFLSDARIAERIIKYVAEFGGEDPFFLSLVMSAVTVLIFTTVGGLPAIMMLGTVMFPILLSMGVPPAVCGGLLMMSFPIGASLNPAVVGGTAAIQRVPLTSAWVFFMWWAGIQAIALLMFLSIEFLRMKRTTVRPATILRSIAGILILLAFVAAIAFADSYAKYLPSAAGSIMIYAKKGIYLLLYYGIAVILLLGILICQWNWWRHRRNTGQWNLLTPVLPLIFVVLYGMRQAIIPAFMASLAYGFFTTPREGGVQKLGRAIIDGIADVAAPAILMVGIGMLIAAALHPRVDLLLTPILAKVVPTRPFAYILFFLLASPLSLYRGPLNNFGLGAGVANLMQHFLPAGATMGALQSVGMLQDPTTTQNVWVCGYLKLDINALLYKLFFYGVGLCVAGLILSSLLYF